MKKVTLNQLATDVAILLGEALSLECQPEESPFPNLIDRVHTLAPGILSSLLIAVEDDIKLDGSILLPENIYHKLLRRLISFLEEE